MQPRARAWALGLAMVWGSLVRGGPARADVSRVELPPAEHFKLDNGLEVLLQEAHHAPLVAVRIVHEIGSRDDPEGHGGLAHLVEHLTYRGSRHLDDLRAMELLEQAGEIETQGVTSLDFTEYYHLVPANALALALWVESERMAFALERFDEATLHLERAIVAREIARRSVDQLAFDRLLVGGMWGHAHVYTRAISRADPVGALTLTNAQWFFQMGYRPQNARLVLVGDFRAAEARGLIERYFAPVVNPSTPFRRAPLACQKQFQPRKAVLEETSSRNQYSMIWGLSEPFTTLGFAGDMLMLQLRKRLRQRLISEQGKALEIRGGRGEFDCGSFARIDLALRREVRPDDIDVDIVAARSDVAGLNWTRALPRMKAKRRLQIIADAERMATLSAHHMRALRRSGAPFDVNEALSALDDLEPEDIDGSKAAIYRALVGKQFRFNASLGQLGAALQQEGQ